MSDKIPEHIIKNLRESGKISKWDVMHYRINRYPIVIIMLGASIGAGLVNGLLWIAHHFVKF